MSMLPGNSISPKMARIATLLMFATIFILYETRWTNIAFLLCAAVVFLFGVILKSRTVKIIIRPMYVFVLFFVVFILLSALWAMESSAAIEDAKRFLIILPSIAMIYITFEYEDNVDPLIDIVLWGGYIVMIYSFFALGGIVEVFNMLLTGYRPNEETFINVNLLGMLGAVVVILQAYKMVYDKKFGSAIFLIPTILVIALSQSKKAIIMLLIGVLLVVFSKYISRKNGLKIIKISVLISVMLVIFNYALNLEIFTGLRDRFEDMFSTMSDSSEGVGESTWERMKFIEIGMAQFWETPILGVGIGSSSALLAEKFGRYTYLHNNYVELLACGGIVGFIIYYSMYVYLISNLIKYRKHDVARTNLFLVLIIVLLFADYGFVSYNVKFQFFYLMMMFMHVDHLKRKHRESVGV